jgi:hypothetical protein
MYENPVVEDNIFDFRTVYLGLLVFNEWVQHVKRPAGTTETDGIEKAKASGSVLKKSTSQRHPNAKKVSESANAKASHSNARRKTV